MRHNKKYLRSGNGQFRKPNDYIVNPALALLFFWLLVCVYNAVIVN